MSTVKISELPVIPRLNQDTTQTLIAGVDLVAGVTGKMTAKVLAQSLYSHDVLNVGNNTVVLPNTIAQFAGDSSLYLQVNLENNDANGTADYIITGDIGSDTTNYIDMGFTNSSYDNTSPDNSLGTSVDPLAGYLYVQGDGTANGNLVIGTTGTGTETRILSGGVNQGNVQVVINSTNTHVKNNLVVDGTITSPSITASNSYANSAFITANASFTRANAASSYANGAFVTANSAGVFANAAFDRANSVSSTLTSTNLTLLSSQNYANNVIKTEAIAAADYANGAFTKANNALANTSGTFAGDLNITGKANVYQQMFVANASYDYTNTALVRIVGSAGAFYTPPANPGYMLAITGVDGVASRVINTGHGTGAYGLFAARSSRGTAETPTAIQSGDVIARYSGSGYNGSAFTSTGQGRIDIVADEDFTVANTGSRIEFYNTITQTNTVTKIATFNATTASFTGAVNPMKGFAYTPNNITTLSTAYTLDFTRDSMTRMSVNDNMTVTLQNYIPGKIVEVWITNSAGQNKTITHGCLANNSTSKSTSFTIQSNSCAFLKYFSINGDLANTFVSITA